jgi:hypothetical protein
METLAGKNRSNLPAEIYFFNRLLVGARLRRYQDQKDRHDFDEQFRQPDYSDNNSWHHDHRGLRRGGFGWNL